jgi:hypothetical protein
VVNDGIYKRVKKTINNRAKYSPVLDGLDFFVLTAAVIG